MSSGVSVDPACATVFNDIKLRHKYRFIVYALTEDLKCIHVLLTAPPSATYDDFVDALKEAEDKKECRYGVFDVDYQLSDGSQRSKLVFYLWSPEGAKIKQKMVYTSSKDYLKRALVGIGKEVQATDHAELAWTNVMEKLLGTESGQ